MIAPIFLPHLGCRQRCIYCNQHHITGKRSSHTVSETIRSTLAPLEEPAEIALYGGSPLGLPFDDMARLFGLLGEYKKNIKSVRMSAEPVKPDGPVIDLLRQSNVTTVELGIPVFSDEKLRALGRHHTVVDLYTTYEALTRAGIIVGLQVMVGLPNETLDDIRTTVRHLLKLKPRFIRIYPLVVLTGTPLESDYKANRFSPLSLEDAVVRALFIYLNAEAAGIKVIKMGLTENEFLKTEIVAGPYHPAFGYLVRSEAVYLSILKVCREKRFSGFVSILLSKKDVPHLTGYRRSNLKRFEEQGLQIEWHEQETMPPGRFEVVMRSPNGMRVKSSWHEAIAMLPF